jgi:electron transfer flavoprotein beta subunit
MKIIVCIKQVPARDAVLRPTADGAWIEESDLAYEINEPDVYALEEGLRLREKQGGETVALSAGPERVTQALREALAKGADRGIHIETGSLRAAGPLETARVLASAVGPEKPDLVLTGLQSDDLGYGQTGVILAELLGMSHATIVMEVEPLDGRLRVKRELEGGWFQKVELTLPAVLTIQSGINKPRYATLMGIKKAKTKEIRKMEAPAAADGAGFRIGRLYAPEKTRQAQLLDGTPQQAAAKLVEKLKFEVRAI